MVQTLQIGRVGLDVDLKSAEVYGGASSPETWGISLSGVTLGSTLAESKVLRDELMALAALPGVLIPITWTADPLIDGFYRLTSSSFDVQALHDRGFIRFTINARRIGTDGDILFRSKLVGTVAQNDHGIIEAETEPFHAPPRASYGYNPGATVPSFVTRVGEDGSIRVYTDVDFTVDPWWSVDAADFYAEAAKVKVGGFLRAGVTAPNTPEDWSLSNGLIEVTPGRVWGFSGGGVGGVVG